MTSVDGLIGVRIVNIEAVTRSIKIFELERADGAALPAYVPGAHVDVHMGDGLSRQYSLVRPYDERGHYIIGVKRTPDSRGGSAFMHDRLEVGQGLQISRPRNNFPLVESAESSVLVAGGIGITPIWCMIQRLAALGRPWRLFYAARSREEAAFIRDIEALGGDVVLHFDDETRSLPDIRAAVGALSGDMHAYCCGPASMMAAFRESCAGHYDDCIHLEYFGSDTAAATAGGYAVVLARSGRALTVQPGQTILDAVLAAGIDHPNTCRQGVCGACETRVLDGSPDHRDMILTPEEKAANRTMMICCSGSLGPRITLDI